MSHFLFTLLFFATSLAPNPMWNVSHGCVYIYWPRCNHKMMDNILCNIWIETGVECLIQIVICVKCVLQQACHSTMSIQKRAKHSYLSTTSAQDHDTTEFMFTWHTCNMRWAMKCMDGRIKWRLAEHQSVVGFVNSIKENGKQIWHRKVCTNLYVI